MERASGELIKSGSRYERGSSLRFFLILFIIGTQWGNWNQVFGLVLPTDQKDFRKLENNHLYFIEGEGALKVRLAARAEHIRRHWEFNRSFAEPEVITIRDLSAKGCFVLQKGFITSIKIIRGKNGEFSSAAKIESLFQKERPDIRRSLQTYYQENASPLRKGVVAFLNSGVAFKVIDNEVQAIYVFKPGNYPIDC